MKTHNPYHIGHVIFGQDEVWETLSMGLMRSIFRNTAAKMMKQRIRIPAIKDPHIKQQHLANFNKLRHWQEMAGSSPCPLVLMDADCLVLADLYHVFENNDYDIVLTSREDKWVNAGVVFIRPGETANQFFDAWVWEDEKVLHQNRHSRKPNTPYHIVGQNQISLWNIYPEFKDKIGWVPCQTYNSCEARYWQDHGRTKVVHVKSALRTETMKAVKGKKVRRHPDLVAKILPYYL